MVCDPCSHKFRARAADSIREQAQQRGLSQLFEEIVVPEPAIDVRRGRRFFPGHVLAKIEMTEEVYHLIKNTPKVMGFLGADNKPMPLSNAEAERMLRQVQECIERPKPSASLEVGGPEPRSAF